MLPDSGNIPYMKQCYLITLDIWAEIVIHLRTPRFLTGCDWVGTSIPTTLMELSVHFFSYCLIPNVRTSVLSELSLRKFALIHA